MTLRERLSEVPAGQWLMCNLARRIHCLMTGIASAGIRSDGLVKAQYTDGEEKEKPASDSMLDADCDQFNLLSIASHFSP